MIYSLFYNSNYKIILIKMRKFRLALEIDYQELIQKSEYDNFIQSAYFWRRKTCYDFPFKRKPDKMSYRDWYEKLYYTLHPKSSC